MIDVALVKRDLELAFVQKRAAGNSLVHVHGCRAVHFVVAAGSSRGPGCAVQQQACGLAPAVWRVVREPRLRAAHKQDIDVWPVVRKPWLSRMRTAHPQDVDVRSLVRVSRKWTAHSQDVEVWSVVRVSRMWTAHPQDVDVQSLERMSCMWTAHP